MDGHGVPVALETISHKVLPLDTTVHIKQD